MNTSEFLPFTRPSIDEATIAGVAEVLRSGWITTGPMVREFENALSQCVGGRPVRSFNSGTAALEIGLLRKFLTQAAIGCYSSTYDDSFQAGFFCSP